MIEQPHNVRLAEPKDALALFEIMRAVWAADPVVQRIPYDLLVLMREAESAANRRDGWLVGICEKDGKPVGSVAFKIDRWWWSADCHFIRQVWLHVDPAHRHGGYDQDLFRFGEWIRQHMARDLAAAGDKRPFVLELSFFTKARLAAYERLWGKWGTKVGGVYHSGHG